MWLESGSWALSLRATWAPTDPNPKLLHPVGLYGNSPIRGDTEFLTISFTTYWQYHRFKKVEDFFLLLKTNLAHNKTAVSGDGRALRPSQGHGSGSLL